MHANANELINEPHPSKVMSQYYGPQAIHSQNSRCCKKAFPVLIFMSLNVLSYFLGYYMSRISDGSLSL
jgi:hypothetical protein